MVHSLRFHFPNIIHPLHADKTKVSHNLLFIWSLINHIKDCRRSHSKLINVSSKGIGFPITGHEGLRGMWMQEAFATEDGSSRTTDFITRFLVLMKVKVWVRYYEGKINPYSLSRNETKLFPVFASLFVGYFIWLRVSAEVFRILKPSCLPCLYL